MSYAWKELGDKKTHVVALPDFPGYQKDKENDRELTKSLHALLESADVVIMHNGDKFDQRKANARFIAHGLRPPVPYKTVDTLKIARKHFAFDSNKLDNLGRYLGCGRKLPHTGKHHWFGAMSGDLRSWRTMKRYNAQDVELLERVYLKLRPWATTHINLNLYTRRSACPVCQSAKLRTNGCRYLKSGRRQQFRCISCGHQFCDGPIIRAP